MVVSTSADWEQISQNFYTPWKSVQSNSVPCGYQLSAALRISRCPVAAHPTRLDTNQTPR